MAINVDQCIPINVCGIFKRCLRQNWTYVVRHSAQKDKPLTLLTCSFRFLCYNTICLSLREKMIFFVFFLSFFFFYDGVNRWFGKVLPMLAQTNGKKKKRKAPRFRPRKHSQSIIIYSHCIAQDHSRTHLKDYFRLMGL